MRWAQYIVIVTLFVIYRHTVNTLKTMQEAVCGFDVCKNGVAHIICDNATTSCSSQYKVQKSSGFLKQSMLNLFNQFRNSWASGLNVGSRAKDLPTASDMHILQWSNRLEYLAELGSQKCCSYGDNCRDLLKGPVAQLVHSKRVNSSSRPPGDLEVFGDWAYDSRLLTVEDIKNVTLATLNMTSPLVLYSRAKGIGCASSTIMYPKQIQERIVICNIYPAGPVNNWPIFELGKPCDSCPLGYACRKGSRFPSLCRVDPLFEEISTTDDGERWLIRGEKYSTSSVLTIHALCCLMPFFTIFHFKFWIK